MFHFEMKAIFLIFTIAIAFSNATIPECSGGVVTFDKPANTTIGTSYPGEFNNSNIPIFPKLYNCDYQINVPQNYSARVHLYVVIDDYSTAPVQVTDQLGRSEEVQSVNNELFFFISTGGKIQLSTGNREVGFGFVIYWDEYPNFTTNYLNISKSNNLPPIYAIDLQKQVLISAETRVSLTIQPPVLSSNLQYMRGLIFFDGPDWNSPYMGTGLQLLNSKSQFVSTGAQLTALYIGNSGFINDCPMIVQDYENTKNITQFYSIYCMEDEDCEPVSIDGTNGVVALQLYHRPAARHYVLTTLNGAGVVKAYDGGYAGGNGNLLAEYDVQNSQLSLPQKFFGQLTTLLFTGGKSTISFTRKRDSFGMTTHYDQSGFISSDPYEPPSSSRHTNVTLHSPDPKLATFKVKTVMTNMVNGSRLTITSYMNEMVLLQIIIDTSNTVAPNSTLRFPGTSLSVEYSPSIADTGAFYMNFQVIKSSANVSIIILIVVILLNFMI